MIDIVSLTVDVEWAAPDVLADLVRSLDERGLRPTPGEREVGGAAMAGDVRTKTAPSRRKRRRKARSLTGQRATS